MKLSKTFLSIIIIFLVVLFLIIYGNKNGAVNYSPNLQLPNLQEYKSSSSPQNLQANQKSQTGAWTLDFPDETGVTPRRIIPSFSSLSACRTEGNRLSPNDYFCSRNCKSVNTGTNSNQELCDVSCTSTRCNYIEDGKPYTE